MNNNLNNIKLIPITTYNANLDKFRVYEENKSKSGIFRLNNLITGKSYIGSSINLTRRFRIYYSRKAVEERLNKGSSIIHGALLKYGYSNFSIDILEYCELTLLINKEQYYLNLIKPEYNILKIAIIHY